MSARGSEEELEQMYGTEVFEKLAEQLELIRTRGTARDDYAGRYDPSTQTAHHLYAVKPDGELLWYRHRAISRKTGQSSAPEGSDRATESDGLSARRQPQATRPSVSGEVPGIRIPPRRIRLPNSKSRTNAKARRPSGPAGATTHRSSRAAAGSSTR